MEKINFEEGVVWPVDKPYGWTSADVVRKIKARLRQAGHRKIKIGHAGTLDPLATGILLICIGRATKRVDALQAGEKEYVAEIELGATTPSYDREHPIDERFPYEHITEQAVHRALEALEGEQEQVPPVYSAKQIDGKRAYEYARQGIEVEMKRARITVYQARLLVFDLPRLVVSIRCSRGTYIRSLARDLGAELGSGAHLTGLRRTRSGDFRAEEALDMEWIENFFGEVKQNREKNV